MTTCRRNPREASTALLVLLLAMLPLPTNAISSSTSDGTKTDLPSARVRRRRDYVASDNIDDRPVSTTLTVTPDQRIYGGSEVRQGRYPYMVAILTEGGHQFCGGTLIASNYVLTAAHCAKDIDRIDSVRIGMHYRINVVDDAAAAEDERDEDEDDEEEYYETFRVRKVILHAEHTDGFDWINDHVMNDVVLLKLNGRSKFDPIRINSNDDVPSVDVDGGRMTILGWGSINAQREKPDGLTEATVEYVPNAVCKRADNGNLFYHGFITQDMMCAAGPDFDKDSCQGDSGGPLIVKGDDASKDVQVGVISWGFGCAMEPFPGVYSRISHNSAWFADELCGGDNPPDLCDDLSDPSDGSLDPTVEPTLQPSFGPSPKPTSSSTNGPTPRPTASPTTGPTFRPTFPPTNDPTFGPSAGPTFKVLPEDPSTNPPTSNPSPEDEQDGVEEVERQKQHDEDEEGKTPIAEADDLQRSSSPPRIGKGVMVFLVALMIGLGSALLFFVVWKKKKGSSSEGLEPRKEIRLDHLASFDTSLGSTQDLEEMEESIEVPMDGVPIVTNGEDDDDVPPPPPPPPPPSPFWFSNLMYR